jgi:sterol desaturase/sphingolipid hydroxylase (fatty acid hydroxylase superfamily)
MDSIVHYFDTIPSAHRSAILIGGLMFFAMAESIFPLVNMQYNKVKHAGINLFFTFTTILINFSLAFMLLRASDWAVTNKFGLLQWVALPTWAFALLGLMLLDLVGAYFIHWLEHRVKWMWQFHLIHHTDTHIDTTSANRHHPGESVFRFVFTTIAVLICGAPMWLVMMYQAASLITSQFIHANISLPKSIDKALSWVLVSPDMHKVHHHYTLPLTDTNFGNIFSIWDRIFGTFAYVPDATQLVYGIDTHLDPAENAELGSLLKVPFQPYRAPVSK